MKFLFGDWRYGKDLGIFIFRVVFGFILLYGHGFGKLSVIFSGEEIQFMDPIGIGAELSFYLAAFAEGICSILLILGLFTRPAAAILTVNFIVIIFHHFGESFGILESRLFYLLSYAALVITGAGRFSLDYFIIRNKLKTRKNSVIG